MLEVSVTMSFFFFFKSSGFVICCDFFPIIELKDDKWVIGLIGFATYNYITNITEGVNNPLRLSSGVAVDSNIVERDGIVSIATGSYETEDIEKYINAQLPSAVLFSLKPINNTVKLGD